MPGYWLYFWSMFRLLPEHPASLALGNALALAGCAWLVFQLSRALGAAPWAALVAAWIATLNTAMAEASFTLSKIEPKQLLSWFGAIMLLIAGAADLPAHRRWLRYAAMASMAAITAMCKETGVTLLVPLFIAAIVAWRERDPSRRRHSAGLVVAGALPVLAIGAVIFLRGVGSGSYAREHVMQGQTALRVDPRLLISKDWALAALFLAGLCGGVWLLLQKKSPARRAGWLCISQLCVLLLFFVNLRALHPYYLVVPAALSACLASAAASTFPIRPLRKAGATALALLLLWTADHGIAAGSALTGWSWLYGRLTAAVEAGRPARVLFYRSGAPEVHFEAGLMWNRIHDYRTEVGVLGGAPDGSGLPVVPLREIRPGDWVVEEFGSDSNRSTPLRDLDVARPESDAFNSTQAITAALARYTATFPAFGHGLTLTRRRKAALAWRISRVESEPVLELEGLTADNWLGPDSALWISERNSTPVVLMLSPIGPSKDGFSNRLDFVAAGGEVIASCTLIRSGPCAVPSLSGSTLPRERGWLKLALRPAETYTPRQLGLGDDPRQLSFNVKLP